MECTGTYGAGLLRYLNAQDIEVLEVTGPDQDLRRRKGKDDTLDAVNAAVSYTHLSGRSAGAGSEGTFRVLLAATRILRSMP